jgi:hypothetical protein
MSDSKLQALKQRIQAGTPTSPSMYPAQPVQIVDSNILPVESLSTSQIDEPITVDSNPKQPKMPKTPQADVGMQNLSEQTQQAIRFFSK